MNTGSDTFASGRILNGLYEVIAPLRQTGNLVVYAAQEVDQGSLRMLKVLHIEAGSPIAPGLAERQQREAGIAAGLVHKNILRAFEYRVAESGEPYMVMESVFGRTLAELIAENNGLPVERAFPLFVQTCEALRYAHEQGVVLGALCPASIMIESQLELEHTAETVKIWRLEGARLLRGPVEWTSDELREFSDEASQYLSPELLQGRPADLRADIFSMGTIMYETLLGRRPFTTSAIKRAIAEHNFLTPPRFAEIRPDLALSPELEKVIRTALERNQRDRYADSEKLRNALLFSPGLQSAVNLGILIRIIQSWFLGNI